MNESDTPRTDAVAVRWTDVKSDTWYVPRIHARELERELEHVRALLIESNSKNYPRVEEVQLIHQIGLLERKLSDEQFTRTDITRKYHDECAALAQKLKVAEEVLKECPWPEDVFAMTITEYCNSVEDGDKRTAISGLMMRKGWQAAREALETAIKDEP